MHRAPLFHRAANTSLVRNDNAPRRALVGTAQKRHASSPSVTTAVVVIFGLVYLGMILGSLPFLQLDRTGVALLGAIAIVASGALSPEQAASAVHLPTVLLLFSFMVISAQLRLGGFYTWVTRQVADLPLRPEALLAVLILIAAVMSAVFSNDIVCLAAAPVLTDACIRRHLNAVPFLLALACAANIGSAATLIGNPQNMLIGARLELDFAAYCSFALPVVVPALALTWAVIALQSRGKWTSAPPPAASALERRNTEPDTLDPWQTAKGLGIAAVLLAVFLWAPLSREVAALTGAGVLLMSRKLHSTKMLGLVDWELLVLFVGLFVVNEALGATRVVDTLIADLDADGLDLRHPASLFGAAVALSNLVSNVPAVMLLLPVATHPYGGPLLALVSTLAGNLLIVGSIANIIVVAQAARRGLNIDWRTHARVGVPVTVATLALAALWLWLKTG